MNAKHESGLTRWARRKAAARKASDAPTGRRGAALPAAAAPAAEAAATGAAAPQAPPPATGASAHQSPDVQPHETPAPQRDGTPEQLPDLETLDYDSDYSRFLSPDIEESVRNMALRRLWRSNPLLANVDGLVDYDDDFSDAATVVEGMKSIYRVGRGMLQDEADDAEASPDPSAAEVEAPAQSGQSAHAQAQEEAGVAPEMEEADDTVAQSAPDPGDRNDDKRGGDA